MVSLDVKKEWNGDYMFTVSNYWDKQSLTTSMFVSDFQINHIRQSVSYCHSLEDAIQTINRILGI